METIIFKQPRQVIAVEVKDFPNGIASAFDKLTAALGEREYFGVTFCSPASFKYFAAAEVLNPDEAHLHGYTLLSISEGEYAAECIRDWRTKIPAIRETFENMSSVQRVDGQSPVVEWYKNDNEMYCMLKLKEQPVYD